LSGATLSGYAVAALAGVVVLLAVGASAASLHAPVRVTLDGVAGVHPGMSAAAVSARWDVDLHLDWELRIDVAANGRVTQIAFGTHAAVRLDEGSA
jgi:hypothetical protein